MNDRIGVEMDEADTRISNIEKIVQPEPTHREILERLEEEARSPKGGKVKAATMKDSLLVVDARRASPSPSRSSQSPAQPGSKVNQALSPRSAGKTVEVDTKDKQADSSAASPGPSSPLRANTKQKQLDDAPQPFRKMVAPSIRNRERRLRKEQGRQPRDPEVESEQSQVYETPAQERKRLHIEELRILQALPRSQRFQALLERQPLADLGAEEEERQHKLKLFLRKINKEEDYPVETIKNLLIAKMKEYEDKKDSALGDAALVRDFSSDDLIEGLCLLHCLKNEEIKANFEKGRNKELVEKSAKMVLKAAKTILSYQNAQGDDQYL